MSPQKDIVIQSKSSLKFIWFYVALVGTNALYMFLVSQFGGEFNLGAFIITALSVVGAMIGTIHTLRESKIRKNYTFSASNKTFTVAYDHQKDKPLSTYPFSEIKEIKTSPYSVILDVIFWKEGSQSVTANSSKEIWERAPEIASLIGVGLILPQSKPSTPISSLIAILAIFGFGSMFLALGFHQFHKSRGFLHVISWQVGFSLVLVAILIIYFDVTKLIDQKKSNKD